MARATTEFETVRAKFPKDLMLAKYEQDTVIIGYAPRPLQESSS